VKMIGTFVHPLALLVELYGKDGMGWVKRKFSVYADDGSPLWPERMDQEDIDNLRDTLPATAFASEYLNQPIVSENPIFIASWMKTYAHDDEQFVKDQKDGLYTVVTLDPAISRRDSADYSAITTLSATHDAEPRVYVRQGGCIRGHWPMAETLRRLRGITQKFSADRLVIETVAFQQAFADEFRRECDREGWYPRLVEVRPDRDKERRANEVTPLLMRNQVFFDRDDPVQKRLIDELLVFPTGDHDDLVDAFVYALAEIKKWAKNRNAVRKSIGPHIVLPGGGRRSPVTGVC
jgi:predicted phage terminase large subunit-like protein